MHTQSHTRESALGNNSEKGVKIVIQIVKTLSQNQTSIIMPKATLYAALHAALPQELMGFFEVFFLVQNFLFPLLKINIFEVCFSKFAG